METLKIVRVRKIAKGKTTNGTAQTINIVVIDTTNGKPSIVRNYAQFLQDLKNSFLIDESVNTIDHPQVRTILKGLKRGTVSGEITYSKKGDTWTVNENSRCVTDTNHPDYGTVVAGDTRTFDKDGSNTEGFLDFECNLEHQTVQATAEAVVMAQSAASGAFDNYDVASSVEEEVHIDDIPEGVLDEAMKATTKVDKK